jgi:hypothetical protein
MTVAVCALKFLYQHTLQREAWPQASTRWQPSAAAQTMVDQHV